MHTTHRLCCANRNRGAATQKGIFVIHKRGDAAFPFVSSLISASVRIITMPFLGRKGSQIDNDDADMRAYLLFCIALYGIAYHALDHTLLMLYSLALSPRCLSSW